MKNWDTNLVIAIGLVTMGIIAVVGWLLISLKTGTSTGTEIPIGIISGLTGVLTGKKLAEAQMQSHQSQTSQTLGQVAEVAQQGQTIADAIDSIKDTLKPKK
jgi:hypothetical protein